MDAGWNGWSELMAWAGYGGICKLTLNIPDELGSSASRASGSKKVLSCQWCTFILSSLLLPSPPPPDLLGKLAEEQVMLLSVGQESRPPSCW